MEDPYMSMIMALATLLLVGLCLAKRTTTKSSSDGGRGGPPRPLGLPLLGHLLHLRGPTPYRTLARLASRLGPILHLQLGLVPAVVLSDSALAREALHTHDKLLASRPPLESLQRLFYGRRQLAVFNSPCSPGWHRTKSLYSLRLFSSHRIQSTWTPIVTGEVRRMLCQIHAAPGGGVGVGVDVSSALRSLLENILSRILFGQPLSRLLLPPAERAQGSSDSGSRSFRHILRQFVILFQSAVIGDFIPFLGFVDYPIKRAMDKWHSWLESLLESALQHVERREDAMAPDAFVSELMACKDFSRDKVKAVLMELLAAGIDTSSVTLDWAMAELLSNRHVLTKLQQEIHEVVGEERLVTSADLPNLPYLKAVIKETFRRHMPAPLLLPRMSTRPCKLGGYDIPQGTRVFVNAWAIANDPQVWTQPQKFIPERFNSMNANEPNFDYKSLILPFGMGRRACPGKPLASLIIELALANLVHTFDWKLSDGSNTVDMSEKFGAVASRTEPIMAIPILRKPRSILQD